MKQFLTIYKNTIGKAITNAQNFWSNYEKYFDSFEIHGIYGNCSNKYFIVLHVTRNNKRQRQRIYWSLNFLIRITTIFAVSSAWHINWFNLTGNNFFLCVFGIQAAKLNKTYPCIYCRIYFSLQKESNCFDNT